MANTSSHQITVDGNRLDTYAYNIVTKTGWDLSQTARGGNQEVPGLDGALWTPNKRESEGRFALKMWVQGSDVDNAVAADPYQKYRQNMDFLKWLFGKRASLLTVQHFLGSTLGTRECQAEVTEAWDPEITGIGQIGSFTVLFNIPSVYWRDTADLNVDLTSATVGQKTLTAFAGGTATTRELQIVFDGPWTNPSIVDDATGHVLTYTGTIASGTQWMVDTVAHTSKTGTGIAFTSTGTQAMLTTTRSGAHTPALFGITANGSSAPTVTLGGTATGAGSRFRIRGRRKYR